MNSACYAGCGRPPSRRGHLLAAIVVLVFGVTVVMAFLQVAVPAVLGLPLPANLPAFALTSTLGGCSFHAIGTLLCGVARNSRVVPGSAGSWPS